MKTIRITYYGMDGEGSTVTDAKRDAGKKIEEALSRIGRVEMVTMQGLSAILYGDKNGYSYKILFPDDPENGRIWGCSSFGNDKDEAMDHLRNHLAQATWTPAMGENHPDLLGNKAFSSWARWQLRYITAKQSGMTDEQARTVAN